MVMVTVGEKTFSIDGILKENLDLVKPLVFKDWDMCFVYAGIEGGGKSTLMFQHAYYLSDGKFNLSHVCFNAEEFGEKITRPNFLQKGDALVLDEGFFVNARSSMTELNRWLLGILSECRQKNLYLFVACPNFFDLDRNIALWRSRGLFYVYHNQYERGFFKYFNYDSKLELFQKGKKFFNYKCVSPDFIGGFSKWMPFTKEEYEKKKLEAFESRNKDMKKDGNNVSKASKIDERIKMTIATGFNSLRKRYNLSSIEIGDLFGLSGRRVREYQEIFEIKNSGGGISPFASTMETSLKNSDVVKAEEVPNINE